VNRPRSNDAEGTMDVNEEDGVGDKVKANSIMGGYKASLLAYSSPRTEVHCDCLSERRSEPCNGWMEPRLSRLVNAVIMLSGPYRDAA
jgi:hypothetical protein